MWTSCEEEGAGGGGRQAGVHNKKKNTQRCGELGFQEWESRVKHSICDTDIDHHENHIHIQMAMRWVDGLPCSIQNHRTGWQKKEGCCNHFSTTIQVGDMGNYTFKLVKSHKVVPPNVLSLFINPLKL